VRITGAAMFQGKHQALTSSPACSPLHGDPERKLIAGRQIAKLSSLAGQSTTKKDYQSGNMASS
jgi:hypothetical protein